MRVMAAALVVCAAACGGQPVLSKLPRPNPTAVAVGAVAVAGAATLANPALAGQKPEDPSAGVAKRTVKTERMPGDVLDRLSDAEDSGEARPAERAPVIEPDAGAFPMPKSAPQK
jgi:hypothetical protein